MLLYLRTSKGDINTQNTGGRIGELVDGSGGHSPWAFPNSLEPYEIRRSQSEFLGGDTGDMLFAVKRVKEDSNTTEMYIGIDGSFYQRYGQRVLDVSDINSIIASAVAKVASTCPFPVGTAFLITGSEKTTIFGKEDNTGPDNATAMAQLLQNQYSGTTWTMYKIETRTSGIYSGRAELFGVRRTA